MVLQSILYYIILNVYVYMYTYIYTISIYMYLFEDEWISLLSNSVSLEFIFQLENWIWLIFLGSEREMTETGKSEPHYSLKDISSSDLGIERKWKVHSNPILSPLASLTQKSEFTTDSDYVLPVKPFSLFGTSPTWSELVGLGKWNYAFHFLFGPLPISSIYNK